MHIIISFLVLIPQIQISAHLVMRTPKQWVIDDLQRPLKLDGSDFPCHGANPGPAAATYVPGEVQDLQLIGSAVHGGGSGQMVITYDTTPTRDSVFKVMTSWEGDHPVHAPFGNFPPDYSRVLPMLHFTVPAGLHGGSAVVAWLWWNRQGNREMYMQCSTVVISSTETSKSIFEQLPTMFRANSGNGCHVPEGVDSIKFKNPGPEVFGTGSTVIDCDPSTTANESHGNYAQDKEADNAMCQQ